MVRRRENKGLVLRKIVAIKLLTRSIIMEKVGKTNKAAADAS
jgi:hypothetical protein